jgi:hypothetical protein
MKSLYISKSKSAGKSKYMAVPDPTKPYHPTLNPDGYGGPIIVNPNDPAGRQRYQSYQDSLITYNNAQLYNRDLRNLIDQNLTDGASRTHDPLYSTGMFSSYGYSSKNDAEKAKNRFNNEQTRLASQYQLNNNLNPYNHTVDFVNDSYLYYHHPPGSSNNWYSNAVGLNPQLAAFPKPQEVIYDTTTPPDPPDPPNPPDPPRKKINISSVPVKDATTYSPPPLPPPKPRPIPSPTNPNKNLYIQFRDPKQSTRTSQEFIHFGDWDTYKEFNDALQNAGRMFSASSMNMAKTKASASYGGTTKEEAMEIYKKYTEPKSTYRTGGLFKKKVGDRNDYSNGGVSPLVYKHSPGKMGSYEMQSTISPYKTKKQIKKYTEKPTDPLQIDFLSNYAGALGYKYSKDFEFPQSVPYEGNKHWNIDRFIINAHQPSEFFGQSTPSTSLKDTKKDVLYDMYKYNLYQGHKKDDAFKQAKRFIRNEYTPRMKGAYAKNVLNSKKDINLLTTSVDTFADTNPFARVYENKDLDYYKGAEKYKDPKLRRISMDYLTDFRKMDRKDAKNMIGGWINERDHIKSQYESIHQAQDGGALGAEALQQNKQEYGKGGLFKKKNNNSITPNPLYKSNKDYVYNAWRKSLPENLRNESEGYNLRGAWEGGLEPEYVTDDMAFHLSSRNPNTGEILKSPGHDTYNMAIEGDIRMGYTPRVDLRTGKIYTTNSNDPVLEGPFKNVFAKGGKMIKRADGSYSQRGLWDNIRANKGSGKKPTKQMLEQERKIKNK